MAPPVFCKVGSIEVLDVSFDSIQNLESRSHLEVLSATAVSRIALYQ